MQSRTQALQRGRTLGTPPPPVASSAQQNGLRALRSAAVPGRSQPRHAVVRFRGTRAPAAPAAIRAASGAGSASAPDPGSLKETLQTVLRDPWDTPPRPWRTFWAMKLAATVVSADDAGGQVEVLPVEMSGLKPPADREDAIHRLKTNAVLYRQNYVLICLGAMALGTLRYRTGPCHLAVLAAIVAAGLASSDRLLGEAQLASSGRLVWNATRVAGIDRALIVRVAPVAAFAAVAACPLVRRRTPGGTLSPSVQARLSQPASRQAPSQAVSPASQLTVYTLDLSSLSI